MRGPHPSVRRESSSSRSRSSSSPPLSSSSSTSETGMGINLARLLQIGLKNQLKLVYRMRSRTIRQRAPRFEVPYGTRGLSLGSSSVVMFGTLNLEILNLKLNLESISYLDIFEIFTDAFHVINIQSHKF